MSSSRQRTLSRPVIVEGFGLFGGADVRMTLLPAADNVGLVCERVELPGRPLIPARIENLVTKHRRTIPARGAAQDEMVETVLSALYGL